MKKTMNNYKMIAIGLATVLTLGLSNATFANTYPGSPAELRFLGNHNSLPVFQLELNNTENAEYIITVRDSDKKILLSEKVKGANISRRYKLDAEEISDVAGTTFEVVNRTTKETSVYQISSTRSIVEDTTVTKL